MLADAVEQLTALDFDNAEVGSFSTDRGECDIAIDGVELKQMCVLLGVHQDFGCRGDGLWLSADAGTHRGDRTDILAAQKLSKPADHPVEGPWTLLGSAEKTRGWGGIEVDDPCGDTAGKLGACRFEDRIEVHERGFGLSIQ